MFNFDTEEHLKNYIRENVLTATESYQYLGITRQGFDKQVQLGRIMPIKGRLFLKSDLDEYRTNLKKAGRPKKKEAQRIF